MIRAILLLGLLPLSVLAQLRIYVAPPNSESPVSSLHDLGSVAAGDALETRFRVRNHGVAAIPVTSLSVAGTGFSLAGQPSLPYVLAPGLNLDFTVRFQARDHGSYSANLAVNGTSVLLRASALAAAVIRLNGNTVTAGSSVDFGRVERGSAGRVVLELANVTTQSVAVRSIQLTGSAFRGPDLPQAADLETGAAMSFSLFFEPKSAGVFTGALLIDGREIRLTGAATEPPFTRPAVVLDSFIAESAKQGRVSVRFDSPSRASGSGKLTLSFQPADGTVDNDNGMLFVASGNRVLPFTVVEGDSEARFGSAAQAVFQTGTTAGTIVLTAEIGGYTERTSILIAGTNVKFDQSVAARNGNSIEVQLTGYDNTQSAGEVSFTFYDRSGKMVQPGALKVNARDSFKRHFESSKLGGTFSLRASFPVAGNASEIESVEVDLGNSTGSSRSTRLRF
jgi:hypothetical protein